MREEKKTFMNSATAIASVRGAQQVVPNRPYLKIYYRFVIHTLKYGCLCGNARYAHHVFVLHFLSLSRTLPWSHALDIDH